MQCLNPISLKSVNAVVPCGSCPHCMKRKASHWSFRLMEEDKYSVESHFITLTYDPKHVPITRNGFMSLNRRDLQIFFKRLRRAHEPYYCVRNGASYPRLKYYAVGEYGGSASRRPHYHILLFNCKLELIQDAWCCTQTRYRYHKCDCGGKHIGHVHYGRIAGASVGYTLKYVSKPRFTRMHRNDDREAEFSVMSNLLGIGYLTDNMVEWHNKDWTNRAYCNLSGGQIISMPRYYKNRLYTREEQRVIADISFERMMEEWEPIPLSVQSYRLEQAIAKQKYKSLQGLSI